MRTGTPTCRERVGILSTWHPEPADNGAKIRIRMFISALSREHDVVLISLLEPESADPASLATVPDVWRQHAVPVPLYRPRSLLALISAFHPYPRSTVATWDKRASERICELVSRYDISLLIGTDLRTVRYLARLSNKMSTILDEVNVSPFVVDRNSQASMLSRVRARLRERKYRHFLDRMASSIDTAVVSSQQEAWAYRELSGSDRVELIDNGVQIRAERQWRPPDNDHLLYTGSLSYQPNAEAVTMFSQDILPYLRDRFPDLRLFVTGSLPEHMPEAVSDPQIELTGYLPDLDELYLNSRLFVVPLRSGTGTRIKVLEAMAHGLPIVTTSKGVEGLAVEPGTHLMIADDPAEFAAVIQRLLEDETLSRRVGANARQLVKERYTWDVQGERLTDLVATLLQGKG